MTDTVDLPWQVKRFDVHELRPGDTIIVTCPNYTSQDQIIEITKIIQGKFPGHTVLVKAQSVEVEFVREVPPMSLRERLARFIGRDPHAPYTGASE
jgi:hypothetical protein